MTADAASVGADDPVAVSAGAASPDTAIPGVDSPSRPTREVRERTHLWIEMSDGVRLAARIWLPVDAEEHPVPALLEYLPYRKNDATAIRDRQRGTEMASYGYAMVRVDVRGSGDSEGLMHDEYAQAELDDGCEVIAWLAEQPWCNGNVGMKGISWGGFNALQIAALRPPALKAIVSVCSTDDRYADDVHYHGGCVIASEMLPWSTRMLSAGARPPDPKHFGEGWREAWFERLDVTPFAETWLHHQRRDDYWKHGSVAEDLDAMQAAVYMVGGWDDAYRDAVLRVIEGYSGPRKGLIGPWGHVYPDYGAPGAPIDFIGEMIRFWDHWLKGIDTGIMDEPMLRVFLRETVDDDPHRAERVGVWATEPSWPSPSVSERRWLLGSDHRLWLDDGLTSPDRSPDSSHTLVGSQVAGIEAGAYMGAGIVEDLPGDQRREDGLALTYDSAPLDAPLTILGQPELRLKLSVDQPLALAAVRLTEITPAGVSRLVARGLLNLTHRDSHEYPTPMVPGEQTEVTIQLSAAGHTFSQGSRLRVAISPTYWPWAWPSPEPVTLSLYPDEGCILALPLRTLQPGEEELPRFVLGHGYGPDEPTRGGERQVVHDWVSGRSTLRAWFDEQQVRLPDGLELTEHWERGFSIVEGAPLSAEVVAERTSEVSRGAWRVRVVATSTMSADATTFHVTNALDAYEGDVRVAARQWRFEVPRDLV